MRVSYRVHRGLTDLDDVEVAVDAQRKDSRSDEILPAKEVLHHFETVERRVLRQQGIEKEQLQRRIDQEENLHDEEQIGQIEPVKGILAQAEEWNAERFQQMKIRRQRISLRRAAGGHPVEVVLFGACEKAEHGGDVMEFVPARSIVELRRETMLQVNATTRAEAVPDQTWNEKEQRLHGKQNGQPLVVVDRAFAAHVRIVQGGNRFVHGDVVRVGHVAIVTCVGNEVTCKERSHESLSVTSMTDRSARPMCYLMSCQLSGFV